MRRLCAVLVLALAMAAMAGCGGGGGGAQTVTVTEPQAAPPPEDRATAPEEDRSEDEPPPEGESSAGSSGGSSGDCIEVPDVEGEDHQLAQDTMQSAGLYNVAEEDVTGQGRALVFDRNWTVVEQEPAAGECVNADRTIVLRSKQDFE